MQDGVEVFGGVVCGIVVKSCVVMFEQSVG